jgi:hypothetical protein
MLVRFRSTVAVDKMCEIVLVRKICRRDCGELWSKGRENIQHIVYMVMAQSNYLHVLIL